MDDMSDSRNCLSYCLLSVFFVLFVTAGCATPKGAPVDISPPIIDEQAPSDFVITIAKQGDTFSSLAARYLKDPSLDWFISEFNGSSALVPGQELVIPLKPYDIGGLSPSGYQTVPVLSYHDFSHAVSNKMTVTKAAFEEQMKFLKENGYRVITMDQLFGFLEFSIQIPRKSVVITIDDGWRSTYDIALPVLKEYGYPATLFIYTDLIVGSDKTLSWELVKELSDNGIDIQCHSKTHRHLTAMDSEDSFRKYFEDMEKEITESVSLIKKKLNRDVKYFAYPYGETSHLFIELLKKHGFRGAFTVKRGSNPFFTSTFRVSRSMIYGEYTLKQFEDNLNVFSMEDAR
jgi:peptidoglycan/xylan/chitin deacetylase (PgdA/CDA1 family)